MRNRYYLIAASLCVMILCVLFIRDRLLQIPQQKVLAQFLERQLPPLEKNKRRIVLLAPDDRFLPLTAGMDIAELHLLPLPRRFAPIDYYTFSGFPDIWLVTAKDTATRVFDGSIFTVEKKTASPRFELSRLTLPDGLSFTDIAGNPGGGAYSSLCPDGGGVTALSLTTAEEGILSITPVCRDAKGREKRERNAGDPRKGTVSSLHCPANAVPNGITFYTDKAIRGMVLRCPGDSAVFDAAAVPVAGRTDMPGTTRTCHEGKRLRGLYGSAGALVDSIGLICGK